MRGCIPFAYTIAPFTIYRPFEQVRVDCCYQNLPVRLVGVGGGVNYSLLGSTHHAQEDIAVMSALPNMTILAPCDPRETRDVTLATPQVPGPVYLRLGKAGEPDLTANAPEPFSLGKIRKIKSGQDAALLTYGPITKMAFDAAARLEKENGISCAVYSVHCLKPLDREGIISVLNSYEKVGVLEEHSPHGGLGPKVKEIAWFVHCYGTHWELLAAHGLNADRVTREMAAL
jgi:transketolase